MLNIAYTAVLSHTLLFATQGTLAQALLSMGISKQKYRSGLLFPSPGGLPDPGIELMSFASPALQMDSLPLSRRGSPYILNENLIYYM